MGSLSTLKQDLQKLQNPQKAIVMQRFFKTGKGQYGEGDIFLGITVPQQREVTKRYNDLPLNDIKKLLESKIHEHRLVAVLILVEQYRKGDKNQKKQIFNFYLANTKNINNWDLVDISAHRIIGVHLLDQNPSLLLNLAKSENLWEKRIAIIATFAFIYQNRFDETLKIAKILLSDPHDLIHKAVGWMLREVGKRDQTTEEKFLNLYYKQMPRTMLRYAIERFDKRKKAFFMI